MGRRHRNPTRTEGGSLQPQGPRLGTRYQVPGTIVGQVLRGCVTVERRVPDSVVWAFAACLPKASVSASFELWDTLWVADGQARWNCVPRKVLDFCAFLTVRDFIHFGSVQWRCSNIRRFICVSRLIRIFASPSNASTGFGSLAFAIFARQLARSVNCRFSFTYLRNRAAHGLQGP